MKLRRLTYTLPEHYFERQKTLSISSSGPHFRHAGPHVFVGTEQECETYLKVMKRWGLKLVEPEPEVEVSSPDVVSEATGPGPDKAPGVQDTGSSRDLGPDGEQPPQGAPAHVSEPGGATGRGAGSEAAAGSGHGRTPGTVDTPPPPSPVNGTAQAPVKMTRAERRAAAKARRENPEYRALVGDAPETTDNVDLT